MFALFATSYDCTRIQLLSKNFNGSRSYDLCGIIISNAALQPHPPHISEICISITTFHSLGDMYQFCTFLEVFLKVGTNIYSK